MMRFLSLLGVALLGQHLPAAEAVWQWSVPLEQGRAFLWVPEDCVKIRGLHKRHGYRRSEENAGFQSFEIPEFDPTTDCTNDHGYRRSEANSGFQSFTLGNDWRQSRHGLIIRVHPRNRWFQLHIAGSRAYPCKRFAA